MRHVPGATLRTCDATFPCGQVRRHPHQAPGPQGVNQGGGVCAPTDVRCYALTDRLCQGRVVALVQGPGQHDGVPEGGVGASSVRVGISRSTRTGGSTRAGGVCAGGAGSGGWCCSRTRKDLGGECVREHYGR